MSKVSRKRTRKSKLTPRKCDIDDENTPDLQPPQTNIAETNSKESFATITHTYDDFEALIDSQNKPEETNPPPLQFSITVAVEEFDENSSDLIIIEPKEQTPVEVLSSDSEANDKSVTESGTQTNVNNDKEIAIDIEGNLVAELVLDRNKILNATNKILQSSTNIADKILCIEVKNSLGQFRTSFEDKLDGKIQRVLRRWIHWQKCIPYKYRSSPLFYKCYICEKSWWYLYDFREHLKIHTHFEVEIEEYTMHEANIIAYSNVDDIIDIKHFYTEGDCPKCLNDFDIHKFLNRTKHSLYSCKVVKCNKLFNNCIALRTHEYMFHTESDLTCAVLESRKIYCKVCDFVFHTQKSYQSHMVLIHTVRSDVVVPVISNICPLCKEKLKVGSYHICSNKEPSVQCNLCFRSFRRGVQFRAHVGQNGHYRCKICNDLLPRQCVEVEHLLKHTDKFIIVKKCVICQDFPVFLSYQSAFNHISVHLKKRYEGSISKYICNILIPKSCLLEPLKPVVDIKEISLDAIIAPELKIKPEILDDLETDAGDEDQVQIKEEIEIHDNFQTENIPVEYSGKVEPDISRIFGIKVEASGIDLKREIEDDEQSEYEDDIIKLDFNFLDNMQESTGDSTEYSIQKYENSSQESMEVVQEAMEGEDEDMENTEELVDTEENKSNYKMPKIYRCHGCGFDAVHKEYQAHKKTHCREKVYESASYKCTKCSKCYDTFHKFIDHFTEHNISSLSCPECYKTLSTQKALESHIATHIKLTYVTVQTKTMTKKKAVFHYKCKLCEKIVERVNFFEHWEMHLSFVEKKTEEVVTDAFDSNIINNKMLTELLERLQSPEPLFKMRSGCPICVKHFERKNDYKRHLVEHLLSHAYSQHYLYKELRCQICAKGFQNSDKYKKHMRDHGDLRDYKCQICDKYFSDSSNYSKHIKLHNVNAYTCDICKKKFQAKYSLEKHIVLHNNQKPILCTPCNKTFYVESAYRKHYRVVHEKRRQAFSCKICTKRFHCLKEKWDHMWYVHKERKYKADCPKCQNSYRKFRDLKTHMKIDHFTDFKYYKMKQKPAVSLKDLMHQELGSKPGLPIILDKDDTEETLYIY